MNLGSSVCAVILAGGKSSRMQIAKAMLPYKSKTFMENIISALQQAEIKNIILSGCKYQNYYSIMDDNPHTGPVTGIKTSISYIHEHLNYKHIIYAAIDMPAISKETYFRLIETLTNQLNYNCTVYKNCVLPFCAVVKDLYAILNKNNLSNQNSIRSILQNLNVMSLNTNKKEASELININEKQEYYQLLTK